MKNSKQKIELKSIETERNITLPVIYKNFYEKCPGQKPKKYIGTDLLSDTPEIQDWAIEILNESGIKNFLEKDDFVFLMHQGYTFSYFKADGKENPDVFNYLEGDLMPRYISNLSDYLKL